MGIRGAYLLYLVFLSLLELMVVLFIKGSFSAYSLCVFALLTTGLFIFRRAQCVNVIFNYLKADFPLLYDKHKRMMEYALNNNKEVMAALDNARLERYKEYKTVKWYQFVAFVLFISFCLLFCWCNGMLR